MKILMTGGTGFIGSRLVTALQEEGHRLSLLCTSSTADRAIAGGAHIYEGDLTKSSWLQQVIEQQDVIINLGGSTIFRRWNQKVKHDIYISRIIPTRSIVEALKACGNKSKLLLNASGVGYYGYQNDELLNEESGPGTSFLAGVAADWETEALKARAWGVKVILCRFGIVLGKRGGALTNMLPFFRFWCGGRWGSGNQWFSWIHEEDLARAVTFLLQRQDMEGPVNFTAPSPVTNSEMSRMLRGMVKRKTLIPVLPAFLIKAILGEFSDVFLKGQRVIPRRLLDQGFRFQYPQLEGCLTNLLDLPHQLNV